MVFTRYFLASRKRKKRQWNIRYFANVNTPIGLPPIENTGKVCLPGIPQEIPVFLGIIPRKVLAFYSSTGIFYFYRYFLILHSILIWMIRNHRWWNRSIVPHFLGYGHFRDVESFPISRIADCKCAPSTPLQIRSPAAAGPRFGKECFRYTGPWSYYSSFSKWMVWMISLLRQLCKEESRCKSKYGFAL